LPLTLPVTWRTCGSRASAAASSSVSSRAVDGRPGGPPRGPWRPGVISMTLVPNWPNSCSTKRCRPSPIEVSRITAAIPTAMPPSVSALRMRWAMSERSAS
jgi:hypothetical protein